VCNEYPQEGKNASSHEESSQTGFSVELDELIGDHGEVAFIIEQDGDNFKFSGYTLPRRGKVFEEGELRNAYLCSTSNGEPRILR
jgi:hypothetical protein